MDSIMATFDRVLCFVGLTRGGLAWSISVGSAAWWFGRKRMKRLRRDIAEDRRKQFLEHFEDTHPSGAEDPVERARNFRQLRKIGMPIEPEIEAFMGLFELATGKSHEMQKVGANVLVHLRYGTGGHSIAFLANGSTVLDLVYEVSEPDDVDQRDVCVDVRDRSGQDVTRFTRKRLSEGVGSVWVDKAKRAIDSDELVNRCLNLALDAAVS